MVSNWFSAMSRMRCGNSIVTTPRGPRRCRSPLTKSFGSGTWARTFAPQIRSARFPSAASSRAICSPKKSTRVGIPFSTPPLAILAPGSIPSTGIPFLVWERHPSSLPGAYLEVLRPSRGSSGRLLVPAEVYTKVTRGHELLDLVDPPEARAFEVFDPKPDVLVGLVELPRALAGVPLWSEAR